MRRSILVAGILLATAAAKAQKGVPFKLKFLPNHTYTVTGTTNMTSTVSAEGQDNVKAKKASERRVESKGKFAMSYEIKTGAPTADGSFPYTLKVTDFNAKNIVNGVEDKTTGKNPIIGGRSAGTCTRDGKLHMQTLTFPAADSKTSKALINMVNKFGDEIQFPNKPMKIGESFTQDKPFNFADAGKDVGVKTVVVYTLRSIKGNFAYFDTKETMTMTAGAQKASEKAAVTSNGSGKGTMVYDIANNFAIAKTDNFNTKLHMAMGTSKMEVTAISITNYKAAISAK